MRQQLLPRLRAAREERERGPHRARRVVERAAQRQLLVVDALGVERRPRSAPAAPLKATDGAAAPHERAPRRASPSRVPVASIATSASRAVARHRAELGRERAPLRACRRRAPASRPRPAGTRRASARSARRRAPRPSGPRDLGALDAVQAARERLDERRDLGGERARHGMEVRRRAIRAGTTSSSA